MQPLRSVLVALAERADVAGAVVVSDDGLVVETVLPSTIDPDELAALAVSAARGISGLGTSAGIGAMTQAVVEAASGAMVLHRMPSGALLVVLAADGGDLGDLLYDLRRHAPALAPLL